MMKRWWHWRESAARVRCRGFGLTVALLILSGCGGSRSPSHVGAARRPIVYESQATIYAVKVDRSTTPEGLLIWEWGGSEPSDSKQNRPPETPFLRLVRVNLGTGEAAEIGRVAQPDPPDNLDAVLDVSKDGRYCKIDLDLAINGPSRSRVAVSDGGAPYTPITGWEDGVRLGPQWSPDGSALAYERVTYVPGGVAPVPVLAIQASRPPRKAQEITLSAPESWCGNPVWAPDGKRVYYMVRREGSEPGAIVAASWPGIERSTLVPAHHPGWLSVASETGDVVFADTAGVDPSEDTAEFRCVSDAGKLKKCNLKIAPAPVAAIVSPDGTRLAVILRQKGSDLSDPTATGLAVYSLPSGTPNRLSGLEGKRVNFLDWVEGGKALTFTEEKKRVWVVPLSDFQGPT